MVAVIAILLAVCLLSCENILHLGAHGFAVDECSTPADCNLDGSNKGLLTCINGICLCNQSISHYVYEYSSLKDLESVTCQSLNIHQTCGNIYSTDSTCACSSGKVAFVNKKKNYGFCHKADDAWQDYGAFCSSIASACNATKLLMCRNFECQCPERTHVYNSTEQTCVKQYYTSGYGYTCTEKGDCDEQFDCYNGTCLCPMSCGPYLGSDNICYCMLKKSWDPVLYKMVLFMGIVLLLVMCSTSAFCIIHRKKKKLRSRYRNAITEMHPHYPTLELPPDPLLLDRTQLDIYPFLNGYISVPGSAPPSAPPLPTDDEAPPTYEEAIQIPDKLLPTSTSGTPFTP